MGGKWHLKKIRPAASMVARRVTQPNACAAGRLPRALALFSARGPHQPLYFLPRRQSQLPGNCKAVLKRNFYSALGNALSVRLNPHRDVGKFATNVRDNPNDSDERKHPVTQCFQLCLAVLASLLSSLTMCTELLSLSLSFSPY